MQRRVFLVCVAAAVAACRGAAPAASRPSPATAEWQDAFDLVPDVYVVVRPHAIKRDPIYGSFWKSVLRVAAAQSSATGVFVAEVADGAEEIVVGVGARSRETHDATLVFRGVPASFDAHRMTDAAGRPMFREPSSRAKVPELARTGDEGELSLFVLPDRTWVIALGAARDRARAAYASPFGRPVPKVDDRALVAIRLDAPALLQPRLGRSPAFGPLVKKLSSLTLALMPAKEGLLATFGYEDEDAAAWGEAHARRLLGELTGPDAVRLGRLEFVKTATISRVGRELQARFDVPTRLLEELPRVRPDELWRQPNEE